MKTTITILENLMAALLAAEPLLGEEVNKPLMATASKLTEARQQVQAICDEVALLTH